MSNEPASFPDFRFEAWAGDQGHTLTPTVHGGSYQDLRTEGAWWAWQAALQHAPVMQPVASGACPACGSACNERDELEKAEREIERLRATVVELRAHKIGCE